MGKNNLNDFRNNSEFSENFFKNFEDISEEEIEFKDFNRDFDEDQLEAE